MAPSTPLAETLFGIRLKVVAGSLSVGELQVCMKIMGRKFWPKRVANLDQKREAANFCGNQWNTKFAETGKG